MAKNILKNPQRRAKLGHDGHDLSFRRDFTCSCGQLLPVMWDFLNPNESIRINDSVFARTQPLLSAAFARCTLHTYYFFVPIYQLDPYFENSFYGINDFHDSLAPVGTSPLLMNGQSPKGPIVSQSILMSNIKKAMFSLSDTTGAGTTGFFINDVANELLYVFGSDHPEAGVDEFGIPIPWNIVRLLDLIGYGSNWLAQVDGDQIGVDPNASSAPSVNVLPLQAYQKIFFDFFRNTQFSANNPFAYNSGYAMKSNTVTGAGPGWAYDYSSIYTFQTGSMGYNIYNGLFKLRYHPMKKDFFTSIQPTPLFDVNDDVQGYNPTAPSGGLILNDYNDSGKQKLYVKKGCQELNGIETLTVARERNAFVGRDRMRQKNAQKIIIAIFNKMKSANLFTKYNDILDALGDSYSTTIPKKVVTDIAKDTIDGANWKFITQSVDGSDKWDADIAILNGKGYAMIPNTQDVVNATNKINKVLEKKEKEQ